MLAVFEHRYADHSLTTEQEEMQASVRAFYGRELTPTELRTHPLSSYEVVAKGLAQLGLIDIWSHGSGAEFTDLIAVAEAVGECLGGYPLAETWAVLRALERAGYVFPDGETSAVAVLAHRDLGEPQNIAGGAVASHLLGMRGDGLVLIKLRDNLPRVQDHAGLLMGRWEQTGCEELLLASGSVAGEVFETAEREWKILIAAMTAGAASSAIGMAVEFANVRETRGVAIGALQAISHPLADVHIGVLGARNLARRAAWYLEHEPNNLGELSNLALVYAARAASDAVHVAVHVHGGQGVSLESDVSMVFERARQWPLAAGNPEALLAEVGKALLETTLGATP